MKRFTKVLATTALIPSLLALSMSAFAADDKNVSVSPAEKAKIESVVHDYILANPNVIVEAIQLLQKKQYEEAEKSVKQTQQDAGKYADALFRQKGDPVVGNKEGVVTVTEFFDYQCPHCVDMAPVMEAVMKTNPTARIVYKEFPIRGEMSDYAARAALAANIQGKYYELHHALLTSKQALSKELVIKLAKNAGIDVTQMEKDMDSSTVREQLKNNLKLAQDLKLFGTPAFFIGKTDASATSKINYVPGQMNEKQLQNAIDSAAK